MTDGSTPDSLAVDEFYARYVETCRRLGVEPVSLKRAAELMDEWNDAINHAPPTSIDFSPGTLLAERRLELQPHLAMPPRIDATERCLLQLFLRRYVTWCARRGRFKQMQGAAWFFAGLAP